MNTKIIYKTELLPTMLLIIGNVGSIIMKKVKMSVTALISGKSTGCDLQIFPHFGH